MKVILLLVRHALATFLILLAMTSVAKAISFYPGEMLVLDSNASAGNGLLFQVNRATGAATPIGSGFGLEPWSLVLQSATQLYAADATGANVYQLNQSTGNWSGLATPPYHLQYPSGGMVANTANSVLVSSGGGYVYSMNTITGQETLTYDYSALNTPNPWGMARMADGSLIIGDEGNGNLVRVKTDGTSSIVAQGLHSVWGVAALPDGTIAVGAYLGSYDAVVDVNLQTGLQTILTAPGAVGQINGLTVDTDGNLLLASGNGTGPVGVLELNLSTDVLSTISTDSHFATPTAILIVPDSIPEPCSFGLAIAAASTLLARRPSRRPMVA